MFHKILCPVDFSESTKSQLDYARGFAKYHQAEIAAVHVLPVPIGFYDFESWTAMERQIEIQARQRMKEFCDSDITPVFARQSDIPQEIVRVAKEKKSDLLLMPTHGYQGIKKLFLGSIFQGVIKKTDTPVLALPPAMLEEHRVEFVAPRSILCAIDLQDGSSELVRITEQLAKLYGAAFTVLHGIELLKELKEVTSLETYAGVRAELKTKIMREFPATAYARDVIVKSGPAHERIREFAQNDGANLVILGISHRSHLRIRTTLYRTVSQLKVPALCVPV